MSSLRLALKLSMVENPNVKQVGSASFDDRERGDKDKGNQNNSNKEKDAQRLLMKKKLARSADEANLLDDMARKRKNIDKDKEFSKESKDKSNKNSSNKSALSNSSHDESQSQDFYQIVSKVRKPSVADSVMNSSIGDDYTYGKDGNERSSRAGSFEILDDNSVSVVDTDTIITIEDQNIDEPKNENNNDSFGNHMDNVGYVIAKDDHGGESSSNYVVRKNKSDEDIAVSSMQSNEHNNFDEANNNEIIDDRNTLISASMNENTAAESVNDNDTNDLINQGDNNDNNNDNKGQTEVIRRRRKRKHNALTKLSIDGNPNFMFPEVDKDTEEKDENAPRYQSNRAAAINAKTKLSLKSNVASGPTTTTNASTDQQELNNNYSRKQRERKSEADLSLLSPGSWVQCDSCEKWRSLPPLPYAVVDQLGSEKWFCTMNIWDELRNNCDAPEETVNEANNDTNEASFAMVDTTAKVNKTGNKRWKKSLLENNQKNSIQPNDGIDMNIDENNQVVVKEKEIQRRRPRNSNNLVTNPVTVPVAAVEWVQCNRCSKWRKVPETIKTESLPDIWVCAMNTWSVLYSRCSAKQEVEQEESELATGAALQSSYENGTNNDLKDNTKGVGKGVAGNRIRRGFGFQTAAQQQHNDPTNPVKKVVQWVQCERKNCKKWRKIPASVDLSQLPEKWFCEMNRWDSDFASCDVPEQSDSEDDKNANSDTRSQLILANSKGPGTLSYRRIIFGNDGKVRSCFSDKNRTGYGIFSYSQINKPLADSDDYIEPTRKISYWWSTSFNDHGLNDPTLPKNEGDSRNNENELINHPGQATHLLDSIRKLHNMPQSLPSQYNSVKSSLAETWPKKISKLWEIWSNLTLLQREKLECSVVRSCFLNGNTSSSPFSLAQLLLPDLYKMVSTSRFLLDEIEACRQYMTFDVLKATLKRLEDYGEVEILYNSNNIINVEYLKPIKSIISEKSSVDEDKSNRVNMPIKLKKVVNRQNGGSSTGSSSQNILPTKSVAELTHFEEVSLKTKAVKVNNDTNVNNANNANNNTVAQIDRKDMIRSQSISSDHFSSNGSAASGEEKHGTPSRLKHYEKKHFTIAPIPSMISNDDDLSLMKEHVVSSNISMIIPAEIAEPLVMSDHRNNVNTNNESHAMDTQDIMSYDSNAEETLLIYNNDSS
eukprot:gene6089-8391_t